MTNIRIRDAQAKDRYLIASLWKAMMLEHKSLDPRFDIPPNSEREYATHIREMIRDKSSKVLVAETIDTREVVGFAVGEIQNRPPITISGVYGFISEVFVSDSHRRQGIGRAFVSELRTWFLQKKAQAMQLFVAEANSASIAFWLAMGMTPYLKLLHTDISPTSTIYPLQQATHKEPESSGSVHS